jgi:hypothetical protein
MPRLSAKDEDRAASPNHLLPQTRIKPGGYQSKLGHTDQIAANQEEMRVSALSFRSQVMTNTAMGKKSPKAQTTATKAKKEQTFGAISSEVG